MYRFSSVHTYNKLKHHKPFHIPDFEYSSLSEIDNMYQSFCNQSRKDLFSAPRSSRNVNNSVKFADKLTSGDIDKNQNSLDDSIKPNKFDHLKEKVLNAYKDQKKASTNLGLLNPVVKLFGNAVIAAIFQSLIIKSVEELFDLHIEDPLAFSNQVLESFGISQGLLKGFKSQEEKNRFILDSMNNTIERLLKNFNEKLEMQEKHHNHAENDFESIKREQSKRNPFKWLIVKTKYGSLEKKLKTLIVQKLNDYENQVKVLEMLKKRQIRRTSMQRIISTDLKLTLNNVNQPMTREMLKTTILGPDTLTSKRTMSSPKAPQTLNQSPRAIISFNLKHKRGQSVKNFAQKSLFYQWKQNQDGENDEEKLNNFLNEEIEKKNLCDMKEKDIFEFTWDQNLEEIFQMSKKTVKNLFNHEKNNGKWNKLAFNSIVQKIFTEEKKNKEHSQLLNIYAEGGHLTPDEFRFLSDTSELLNSCIDKKFFQKAVNIIDPNILHFMELNLAEQIIKQHKAMEEIVMLARNEFYKAKNEQTVSKIAVNDAKNHRECVTQKNKEDLLRKQKVFIYAMNKIEKKEKEKRLKKEEKLYIDINKHKTFNDYEKEVYKEIKSNSMRRLELKKKLLEPKTQISFISYNHPSVVKHRYHPASKLFYFDKKGLEEKKDVETYVKFIKKTQEDFKINVTSPQILRMPQNFKSFYSGGPSSNSAIENNIFTSTGEPLREPTRKEIKSSIMIQSKMRGFLARKHYKERIDEKIKKNYIEMSEKVNFIKDLTLAQNTHDKSLHNRSETLFSFIGSNSTKTHKKMNSLSTDVSGSGRTSFKNYKYKAKSVKNEEIFHIAKKLRSFNNNLAFCYSKKELNMKDNMKNTPLYYAAKNGNLDFCEYLLENGGSPNEICSYGDTPLHIAMKTNKHDLISMFLKFYPNFTILNENNQTPLDVCSERTLSVFNLKKTIIPIPRMSKTEVFNDNSKAIINLMTEKSAISNTSESQRIRKTLSFRKNLVEVI